MAKTTLVDLKSRFETGDAPAGADFVDLIDTLDDSGAVDAAVAALVNSAPATLDTLKEIADALAADESAAAALATTVGLKANKANDTLTNPTITNYVETVYAPAAGASFTLDLANGTIQKLTTNGNAAITLPASVAGKCYTVIVSYGGAHTVTFAGGTAIKWAGGTAPTATSVSGKFDIYVFTCDGTNTYASDGGRNF